jgi:hypothetical protein
MSFPKELFGRVLGSSTAVGQISYALVPSDLGGGRDLVGIKAVLDVCIGLQLLAATLMALRLWKSANRAERSLYRGVKCESPAWRINRGGSTAVVRGGSPDVGDKH